MSGYTDELFTSYSAVEARREWEIGFIKEKLAKNEQVDLPVCRVERVSSSPSTVRFGLKRGKLLYLFKYPTHDVEREKHRNVITRARYIKDALEQAGYRLIPWDFKKGRPPNFWEEGEGRGTMEEEDDDLYGPDETVKKEVVKDESASADEDEPMLESGEEEDEDDSDSDLEIIIDKPAVAPKPAPAPQESKAIKIEAPPKQTSAPSQQAPVSNAPSAPSQPGTAYPAIKTSTIDVNADPVYPQVGKPISQIDMDADMAEATKPWRLPGADQSDYFNYGFDEFTWEMYRQRQTSMQNTLANQKAEVQQFQQMFGGMPSNPGPNASGAGAGAPGVPGAPTGPGGGGGMGGGMGSGMGPVPPGGMTEEQMQMMMAQMAQSGIDPTQMDFSTFMAMAGGFGAGGGGGPGFGGGGPAGNQGGGGRGGGRRGRGGW